MFNERYNELVPQLDNVSNNYSTLSDEETVKITFDFVQQRVEIPVELVAQCKAIGVWNIIEPLLGEDVDEMVDCTIQ